MNDFHIFIQARQTSSRLPGKALLPFSKVTVIERIFYRVGLVANTTVLIPDTKGNDDLAGFLKDKGIPFFRGDENNVLARFYSAYKSLKKKPKHIIRITADCPFISTYLIRLAMAFHKVKRKDYTSFACHIRSIPSGLDVEVFTAAALKKAATSKNLSDYQKEHVTPWMKLNAQVYHIDKCALDTAEDYKLAKQIDAIINEWAWAH